MTKLLKSVSYVGSLPSVEILQSLFHEVLDLKKEIKTLTKVVLNGRNINSEQFSHKSTTFVNGECLSTRNSKNVDSLHEQNAIKLIHEISAEPTSENLIIGASCAPPLDTFKNVHEDATQVQDEILAVRKTLAINSSLHEKKASKVFHVDSAECNMNCGSEKTSIKKALHVLSSDSFRIIDEDVTKVQKKDVKAEETLPINSFLSNENQSNIDSSSSVLSVYVSGCGYDSTLVSSATESKYLENIPELNLPSVLAEEKNEKHANVKNKDFSSAGKVIKVSDDCYFAVSANKTQSEEVVGGEVVKNFIAAVCNSKPCTSSQCADTFTARTEHKEPTKKCKQYGKAAFLHKERTSVCTSEYPTICPICDKSLSYKNSLKRHMKVHTGEKPYVCTVCSKAFSQSCILKRHMRIHTGERPYVCSVCSKAFSQKCVLKRHMVLHTGKRLYVCSVCNKAYSQKWDLKYHMVIHTDKKPYACSVCNKVFKRSCHLRHHMRDTHW